MKSPVYRYFQYLIAVSIAWFEGYFQQGTRAFRNRNPGNLRGWSKRLPKDEKGFDIFETHQAGWEALFRQVKKNIDRKLSVPEFIRGKPGVYAGYSRTDQEPYIDFLQEKTGIVGNVPIISVITDVERRIFNR